VVTGIISGYFSKYLHSLPPPQIVAGGLASLGVSVVWNWSVDGTLELFRNKNVDGYIYSIPELSWKNPIKFKVTLFEGAPIEQQLPWKVNIVLSDRMLTFGGSGGGGAR
jgi:hypothetical protein